MFLIQARYIFVCDEAFNILENKAFVFDENFKEFGEFKILRAKYPKAKLIKTPQNSLILPAFINPHTHLEYSANSYTLEYGDFIKWLSSVIKSRETLSKEAKNELILNMLKSMQKSGTATIGEISSFGSDLQACVQSSMRVVFFNEILGANEEFLEAKKSEFMQRFKASLKHKSELFIPALSIHSPYSTHIELAKFITDLAKKENLLLSTHFLESKHELDWLRTKKGKFKKWLSFSSKNPQPFYDEKSFITLFKGLRTLFTHCVFLQDFNLLDKNLHSITHCAYSNRLLSKKSFNLNKALKNKLNVHLGTDGLSSNISLSMLDEMRANLLIHKDLALEKLASRLILMATLYPARALNLNLGELKPGKIADFSVFEVKECQIKQLALQFILNAKEVTKLFIKGKQCQF